jgi:hypothetical protein
VTDGAIQIVIALVGLAFTMLAGAFVFWRWTAGTIRAVELAADLKVEKLEAMVEARLGEIHARITAVKDKQAAFELEVAKYYASDDRLHEIEIKFTSAIEKLINRFDAFATDFHKAMGRLRRDDVVE